MANIFNEFSGLGTPTNATRREPEGWNESAYKIQEANLPRKSLGGLNRTQTSKSFGEGLFDLGTSFLGDRYAGKVAGQNVEANEALLNKLIAAAQGGNLLTGDLDVTFDPITKTYTTKKSDRREGMLTSLYDQTGGYADQLANLDPYALGEHIYNLKRPTTMLDQDRQMNQLLERLEARRITDSNIADLKTSALSGEHYRANQEALAADILSGQQIAGLIHDRQRGSIADIFSEDTATQNAIKNAINMGVSVTEPKKLGEAYQTQMDTRATTGSNTLESILSLGKALLFS